MSNLIELVLDLYNELLATVWDMSRKDTGTLAGIFGHWSDDEDNL